MITVTGCTEWNTHRGWRGSRPLAIHDENGKKIARASRFVRIELTRGPITFAATLSLDDIEHPTEVHFDEVRGPGFKVDASYREIDVDADVQAELEAVYAQLQALYEVLQASIVALPQTRPLTPKARKATPKASERCDPVESTRDFNGAPRAVPWHGRSGAGGRVWLVVPQRSPGDVVSCWICGGSHNPTPAEEQEVRDAAERILSSKYLRGKAGRPPDHMPRLEALLRDTHLVATAVLTMLPPAEPGPE